MIGILFILTACAHIRSGLFTLLTVHALIQKLYIIMSTKKMVPQLYRKWLQMKEFNF